MKKISRIIIPALLLLSFIAPACGEFEEIDLPEKIVLPKEGGKLYIYSKSGIYGISLDNAGVITTDRRYHYGDREPPLSLDTLTSGWLKVVNPRTCRNEFYFIAEHDRPAPHHLPQRHGNELQLQSHGRARQIIPPSQGQAAACLEITKKIVTLWAKAFTGKNG